MSTMVEIIPDLWISNYINNTNQLDDLYNIKYYINADKDLCNFDISESHVLSCWINSVCV